MTNDNFCGANNADDGSVLRPSLMAVVLIVFGIVLWMWNDVRDTRAEHPAGVVVGHS